MKRLLFLVAVLGAFLSSCGDEEVVLNQDVIGTSYYPLEMGSYKVFNVKEKSYVNNEADSITYQLKETVNETFKDQAGKDWYRVEISRRETSTDAWRVTGVRTISRDSNNNTTGSLLIKENNRTVVGMVYPVAEGKEWNPNAFNTGYFPNPDDESLRELFYYKDVAAPFTASGMSFPNTLTVVKGENSSSLQDVLIFEVLSLQQGPVHRYYKVLNYCDQTSTVCDYNSDDIFIVKGTERTETVESFGKVEL